MAYFLRLLLEVRDVSSPDGLIDHAFQAHLFWFTRLSLFQPGLSTAFFYGIYTAGCLGAWGLVLGYRVKLCAALLFVIAVSHYRWNFLVFSVDDSLIHLFLFWLLLLPVGHTLCLQDWLRQRTHCLARWSQVTVPGGALRCFLGNICLVYLVSGLWKLESPLWRQGFALYATLRLPIAYAPDFWQPEHLPFLRVSTYVVFILEPLLPLLLLQRPGHPLKWCGLLGQLGFHLGIIVTLRVPYANLGLLASAVLFFREELMRALLQRQQCTVVLRQTGSLDRLGRIALVFLLVLTLAMLRRLPGIGMVHMPAYALLWVAGIAQDYQLFNWIDKKNYYVVHFVTAQMPGHPPQSLDATMLFPRSLRSTLLQTYLRDVRWMPLPPQHRPALKQILLQRFAQRFCTRYPTTARVNAGAVIQRILPENSALTRGRKQFWMEFRCVDGHAILCRTMLQPRGRPDESCVENATSSHLEPLNHR
jgi:hypothetical protein